MLRYIKKAIEMLLPIFLFFAMAWRHSVAYGLPPSDGECKELYLPINPLKIMDLWHVMEHTDNLTPNGATCYKVKFGRRVGFDSNFRMDIKAYIAQDEDYVQDFPILRGDVSAIGDKPFSVSGGGGARVFPPNVMISHFDEKNDCLATWTCEDVKAGVQKAAWIMCKSPDTSKEVVQKLKEAIAKEADIDISYFQETKNDLCN